MNGKTATAFCADESFTAESASAKIAQKKLISLSAMTKKEKQLIGKLVALLGQCLKKAAGAIKFWRRSWRMESLCLSWKF